MDTEDRVREHYRADDLEARVFDALRRAGVDPESLHVGDLAGLDHLHAGSAPATEHLLRRLDLSEESSLLDVGCGIGGPARLAAAGSGCRVWGIDLSPDFVTLARQLTDRAGLADQVTFDVGSATALPYPDGFFTRAMLNHVGMNLPDKLAVFTEVRRVLEPGGRFGVFEQMRTGPGELTFPLPWADDERSSFVEARDRYTELLETAGFRVEIDEDRVAAVAATGPPAAGELNPGDLFGSGFAERLGNNIAATIGGTLSPVLMVARAV